MKKDYKLLWEIYKTFFEIGICSFGGGYAVVSLIEHVVVEEKKWVEKEKLIDVLAVSQSIPGAIALNSSGLVGYYRAGTLGAVIALLGNLTPSAIIVLVLSVLFEKVCNYPIVQAMFYGIRPAIIGLIAFAAVKMGKTAIKDFTCIVIVIAAFIAVMFLNIHPVLVIIFGGILGIVLSSVKNIKSINTEKNK